MRRARRLTREQRDAVKRHLRSYRADAVMLAQLRKLYAAALGRIDESRATLLTVRTPDLREAVMGSIEAEEECLLTIQRNVDTCTERMRAVEGTITGGRLDPLCSELLQLRYLEGLPWARIAEAMVYTDNYVTGNLHRKALEEYAEAAGLLVDDC